MNEDVYNRLVEVARSGGLISYSDLASEAGLNLKRKPDSEEFVRMLDAIADHELANGRPLLPALVVRGDTQMPSGGLLKYAKAKNLPNTEDEITFFATESRRVYAEWKPA